MTTTLMSSVCGRGGRTQRQEVRSRRLFDQVRVAAVPHITVNIMTKGGGVLLRHFQG